MLNAYASSGGDEIVTAYVPATASRISTPEMSAFPTSGPSC